MRLGDRRPVDRRGRFAGGPTGGRRGRRRGRRQGRGWLSRLGGLTGAAGSNGAAAAVGWAGTIRSGGDRRRDVALRSIGRPSRARARRCPWTWGAMVPTFVMMRSAVTPAHRAFRPGTASRSERAPPKRRVRWLVIDTRTAGGSIGPIRRPMIPQARARPRRGSAVDDV